MTRLTEANTSAEIGLSRYFRPYTEKRDLLVLVEGDDDVFFWKKILEYAKDKYARIDVHTLKLPDAESHGTETDRKGKRSLMEDVHDLGPSKVVAVDMDYDHIVSGYHSYSARIGHDPCVLHTIYYSMENHKLYPDILQKYVSEITQEEPDFDFDSLVASFSTLIAPFLRLIIIGECKRADNTLNESEKELLSIKGFRADIANLKFTRKDGDKETAAWLEYMNGKYGPLLEKYHTATLSLKEELTASMGISEKDYWKLLQGHTLAGYLLRVLKDIAAEIQERKEKETIEKLTDKSKVRETLKQFRDTSGIGSMKMHEYVKLVFTQRPVLSENDPGIPLIRQQIDRIPAK